MRIDEILDQKGHDICAVPHGTAVGDIVKTMAEERIGTVLVTDQDEKLSGILSERDVIKHLALRGAETLEMRAEDIMVDNVITCTASSALESALAEMSTHSIRHLPVVKDGVPVGIVSVRDLLDAQRELLIEDIRRRRQAVEAILMSQLD